MAERTDETVCGDMKVSSEDKVSLGGHSLALKDAWMQVPQCPEAESWTKDSRGGPIFSMRLL